MIFQFSNSSGGGGGSGSSIGAGCCPTATLSSIVGTFLKINNIRGGGSTTLD